MNNVYVLQDKTGYVVGATYEEPKAIQMCKENQWTYRMIPFYSCEGTQIFPSSERTLMGDFKADAS